MDILGIDIGTISIKYLRWRGKKGRGVVFSSNDYDYDGGWEDLQKILTVIRADETGDVEVALGITSKEILRKTFTIPILPKDELKDALAWSASKVVSTPLEEMVYQTVMLGEIDERGIKKDEVLFVGAARSFIDRLLAACEDAGFRKVRIITDTGLLYPALIDEKTEDSVAVVDIGGRQTGIYIIHDKKLRFVREIMTASESFSGALVNGFGFSREEAERYKRERGFNEESAGVLAVPIDRLTGEIQRTFDVYSQRYPERPVTRLYLSGRGAGMPHFIPRIKEYVGGEIEMLSPPEFIENEFLLCYALCTTKESLVNLLPGDIQERAQEETYKKWARIASIVLCAILVIFSLNVWSKLVKTKLAIQVEQTNVASKREQIKISGGFSSLSRYNELLPKVKELQKRDETFLILAKYLSSHLPKDVYLSELEFDKYKKLKVYSDSQRTVASAVALSSPSSSPSPASAASSSKDDFGMKDAIKTILREALQLNPAPGEDAARKENAGDGGGQAKEDPRIRYVTLRGYVIGDVEGQGLTLLDLVIQLEKSGFLRDVDVVGKEAKEIKGKKVTEFTIEARCTAYEV